MSPSSESSDSECGVDLGYEASSGSMVLDLDDEPIIPCDEDFPMGPSVMPPVQQHLVAYITPKTASRDTTMIIVNISKNVLPLLVLVHSSNAKGKIWPWCLMFHITAGCCSYSFNGLHFG